MYTKIINESNQTHCVNYITIMIALLEKGIVSEEDLEKARIKATHIVDQEWAKKQEEAQKTLNALYPGLGKFLGKIFGSEGDEK